MTGEIRPPSALVTLVARHLVPYIDLLRLTGENYHFRKESTGLRDGLGEKRFWHPMIEHRLLREYHHKGDKLLYVAFPKTVDLKNLTTDDLLYIGCSVGGGSRFWRGKINATTRFPKAKSCFHHEPMRRGRDGHSIETFLSNEGAVTLYTITSTDVLSLAFEYRITLPEGKYPAHQLERKILAEGFRHWKWNARK